MSDRPHDALPTERSSSSGQERGRWPAVMASALQPVDLPKELQKIELYLGQVCSIAGISKTQLDYWTAKADIPTHGKKQRLYDMDALELVLLIKQARDRGLTLDASIEAARRFKGR